MFRCMSGKRVGIIMQPVFSCAVLRHTLIKKIFRDKNGGQPARDECRKTLWPELWLVTVFADFPFLSKN